MFKRKEIKNIMEEAAVYAYNANFAFWLPSSNIYCPKGHCFSEAMTIMTLTLNWIRKTCSEFLLCNASFILAVDENLK